MNGYLEFDGKIGTAATHIGLGGAMGAMIGLGVGAALQNAEKLGWAEAFWGARLGLMSLDFGALATPIGAGAAVGVAGMAVLVGGSALRVKLASRSGREARSFAPRRPGR